MDDEKVRSVILDTFIVSLEAQLRAVRRLRGTAKEEKPAKKSMSNIDMVYDILRKAGSELHISEIIDRGEKLHGLRLDRESIVSALSKKIKKGDRFLRVGKNVYTLREEDR